MACMEVETFSDCCTGFRAGELELVLFCFYCHTYCSTQVGNDTARVLELFELINHLL